MTQIKTRIRMCQRGTRQFTDKTIHRHGFRRQLTDRFEDSSPTELKILWEIVARKPDFAAMSRTHNMHRLALLYVRVLGLFLSVLSHAMLPSEGSRLDDPNQNTHPHVSAGNKTVHRQDNSPTRFSKTIH